MIILAAHVLAAKLQFLRTKKLVKEYSLGAKVDFFLILNTAIKQKMKKKKKGSYPRHFKEKSETVKCLGTFRRVWCAR